MEPEEIRFRPLEARVDAVGQYFSGFLAAISGGKPAERWEEANPGLLDCRGGTRYASSTA
jgi:hypothetical protein